MYVVASTFSDQSLPLQHFGLELDQKHRLARPHLAFFLASHAVRRHAGGKRSAVADALDYAGHEGRAVQLAHLARDADVGIDQRFVVDDHVLVGGVCVGRLLEPVGLSGEEVLPDVDLDEMQQGDDGERPGLGARGLAEQEEVEQLEADGVALDVESMGSGG